MAQAAPPEEPRADLRAEPGIVAAKGESNGGLPFSGLDVALLLAGGTPLLLIGASLRRRRPEPAVKAAQEETLTPA